MFCSLQVWSATDWLSAHGDNQYIGGSSILSPDFSRLGLPYMDCMISLVTIGIGFNKTMALNLSAICQELRRMVRHDKNLKFCLNSINTVYSDDD